MKCTKCGRRRTALVAVAVLLGALLTQAAITCYLGVFTTAEGETNLWQLNAVASGKCSGGVLSYAVTNAHGNVASFPNAHQGVLQFRAANTGMTSGRRQTQVDVSVMCNGVTAVCDNALVYFKVLPGATTSTTTTTPVPSSTTCVTPIPITVPNYVTHVVPSSAFTSSCSAPTLTIQSQTAPSGAATSLFKTEVVGGTSSLLFNEDGVNATSGTYTATVSVKCGTLAPCVTTQQIVVGTSPTTTTTTTTSTTTSTPSPLEACPGDYAYSFVLNADGTFTAQTASLADRAAASGKFCTSGGRISSTVGAARTGVVTSNPSAGTFSYASNSAVAGDAVDSFDFVLTCSGEGTSCSGRTVISIVGQDSGKVYYAMDGAITCRGTCDAGAWRSSPSSPASFDVNKSGVAVTPRKDGRAVDGVDFGFTVDGELLIRAYTTIGNLAARFVTFYPMAAAKESGYVTSSSVPPGSHVSFEPTCLDQQVTTGRGSDIWSWTSTATLTGHLNTQTNAYKSGDNYYQKFGGNHRQCDVYRENPCKYAPFMTPTLNDDNNNAENNRTASVQWKLYVNDCDATWVGKASVESLRALRQPDGSSTFKLEEHGTYLVGTVYSQSVKPADWTSPSSGIVHIEQAYAVRLKIHNTLVVDAAAQPISASVVPTASQLSISADVQFASGKTKDTDERLFAYSLLLYPVFAVNNTPANITTLKLKVASVSLLHETWTSPSHVECPMCTGSMISCTGTGNKYETDCGSKALMTFEDISETSSQFEDWGGWQEASSIFASTTVATQNAFNVTFAARANGKGSASATDAYPVGSFAMAVKLSDGQTFHVVVNQTDYISELNTRFLNTEMCRPSGYWPVADPLGSSVPVQPYNSTPLAFPGGAPASTASHEDGEKDPSKEKAYLGAPERLTPLATCDALPNIESTHVQLTSLKANITDGDQVRSVSMCAVADERTFGVTDWVMFSLPSIQEELEKVTAENIDNIIADRELTNDDAYTVAELQYLMLSVPAAEIGSSLLAGAVSTDYINILLDGDNAPPAERTEEEMWMQSGSDASSLSTTSYLPWEVYASSLSYRRIGLRTSTGNTSIISEPFNFAFIPGSLLHSSSSVRVQMAVSASIRFSTYAHTAANATHASQVVKTAERDEGLLYVVSLSRSISSALRFESDTFSPVKPTTGSIGKKSATAILIVLIIAIICVLAASVYVEVTYKRIIHNAKYHPKRPDSAVGIRYGRDGKPKENQKTAKEGSRAEVSMPASASKTRAAAGTSGDAAETNIKTKFGVVRGEQTRIPEAVAGSSSASSGPSATAEKKEDTYKVVNPPIGEEQTRVADDEVAQF
ncbi:hypothetical protein ABB37_01060 [Leptomonas pyrrhocoris]|uniref:Uncharacterized protein n=1 Tax=Leptomonas pyrrhocoris TaxID=157538 RepID=A0A0N0DYU2_LEPPY|nr:hypothetical protein ABB37_01060 [Leptomonas pyrrhocoris]KPA84515.1 hypothetical protein ABB37_01060 [Leptomonas pyrrhocoris]|eukprot:XP_015662954.1 hypothetical protein ABB37_01060 [Leptomonas pyrrhocoris]